MTHQVGNPTLPRFDPGLAAAAPRRPIDLDAFTPSTMSDSHEHRTNGSARHGADCSTLARDDLLEGPVIELGGQRLRVVCVDERAPRQLGRGAGDRVRLVYHRAEVAHFSVGTSRYALVPEDEADTGPAPLDENRPAQPRDPRLLLSGRELQIVQLICMGLLTKQVADRLHLSEFTVRSYLKTIYCKLGVRSRGGMVFTYAKAFGIPLASAPTEPY